MLLVKFYSNIAFWLNGKFTDSTNPVVFERFKIRYEKTKTLMQNNIFLTPAFDGQFISASHEQDQWLFC
jgi:hypothetical protein